MVTRRSNTAMDLSSKSSRIPVIMDRAQDFTAIGLSPIMRQFIIDSGLNSLSSLTEWYFKKINVSEFI